MKYVCVFSDINIYRKCINVTAIAPPLSAAVGTNCL